MQPNEFSEHKALTVHVIEEKGDGELHVAVCVHELGQAIILTTEQAKEVAFRLIECADYITPPFQESTRSQPTDFFAAYNSETLRKKQERNLAARRKEEEDFEDEE